jgi:hypothetical protein
MIRDVNRTMDDSMFKVRACESMNAMLACLLNHEGKICKNCIDVDVCTFLTEALFAYRNKYERKYLSALDECINDSGVIIPSCNR